jgi:hypothetical protein
MNKEEIIEMAKQVGFEEHQAKFDTRFEPFAKLIEEKEREACAKIVENRILHDKNENIKKGYFFAQQSIAKDIRARGQE